MTGDGGESGAPRRGVDAGRDECIAERCGEWPRDAAYDIVGVEDDEPDMARCRRGDPPPAMRARRRAVGDGVEKPSETVAAAVAAAVTAAVAATEREWSADSDPSRGGGGYAVAYGIEWWGADPASAVRRRAPMARFGSDRATLMESAGEQEALSALW